MGANNPSNDKCLLNEPIARSEGHRSIQNPASRSHLPTGCASSNARRSLMSARFFAEHIHPADPKQLECDARSGGGIQNEASGVRYRVPFRNLRVSRLAVRFRSSRRTSPGRPSTTWTRRGAPPASDDTPPLASCWLLFGETLRGSREVLAFRVRRHFVVGRTYPHSRECVSRRSRRGSRR